MMTFITPTYNICTPYLLNNFKVVNFKAQKMTEDSKLLDALFAVGSAAYERAYPNNPWGDPAMAGCMAIQKVDTSLVIRESVNESVNQ